MTQMALAHMAAQKPANAKYTCQRGSFVGSVERRDRTGIAVEKAVSDGAVRISVIAHFQ